MSKFDMFFYPMLGFLHETSTTISIDAVYKLYKKDVFRSFCVTCYGIDITGITRL